LHVINLQIFRHITHNFLTIRQYAFKNSMQSDEKYICVSAAQSLCGGTFTILPEFIFDFTNERIKL